MSKIPNIPNIPNIPTSLPEGASIKFDGLKEMGESFFLFTHPIGAKEETKHTHVANITKIEGSFALLEWIIPQEIREGVRCSNNLESVLAQEKIEAPYSVVFGALECVRRHFAGDVLMTPPPVSKIYINKTRQG